MAMGIWSIPYYGEFRIYIISRTFSYIVLFFLQGLA